MDLEDLAKLAANYGVHPATLLFAPDVAQQKVGIMQEASTLAEQMDPDAAQEWIAMGRRVASL